MNTLAIEEMDQETADTIDLLMCVASAEQYGYDATMLAYIESRGLLASSDLVGLEAVDPANKDKSEVRNAASGRIVAAKAKFDGRMDGARKDVDVDIEAIKQRLNNMPDKEKKELPWGKIGAAIGVLDGVRKYFQVRNVMSSLHESLTSAGNDVVTSHIAELKSKLPKIQAELDAAKHAGAAGAPNVSGLEAQLKNTQSAMTAAKEEGGALMRAVAGAKLNFAGKAAMFVACIAWYTFIWWLTVKIVVAVVRWIKKLVVGSGSSK